MWPALHVDPCVLSITLSSRDAVLTAASVTNASWSGPNAAGPHSMLASRVLGTRTFAPIEKPLVWSIQLAPTTPSARLKLSSSGVDGNVPAGGVTEIATLAVSVPPRPSFAVRIAG